MAKRKKLSLPGRIVTAWAENPSGPDWSNRLVWVPCRLDDGTLKEVPIQPEDQTPSMVMLFGVSLAATTAMTGAVEAAAT